MQNFLKSLFSRKRREAPPDKERVEPFNNYDLNAVVLSDLGNVRKNNEDTGLVVRLADSELRNAKGYLLLVADGMGGHLAGEVASQMASEVVSQEYVNAQDTVEKSLYHAFQKANQQIFTESRQHDRFRGMGTTCTVIVVHQHQIYFGHVGDSRAYLFKNGEFIQLTEDHTYVRELVRLGEIREEEAATHPDRNVLTQAMGTKAEVQIDIGRCLLPFDPTDRLLLCSDGLYEYCRKDDFIRLLSLPNLSEAARELVALAKARGGHDNITVVVAEWVCNPPEGPPKETRDIDLTNTQDV